MSLTAVLLILVLVLLVAIIGVLAYMFKKQQTAPAPDSALLLLQNQMGDMARSIEARLTDWQKLSHDQLKHQGDNLFQHLAESNKMVQGMSAESNKIIKEITTSVTKLDETNKQVVGFATQLQSLQDVLQNPKRRGVLGEYYLEMVLKNVLPPDAYALQYKKCNWKTDDGKELIPDAVIFYQDKIVPIDSKFSLENYNRALEAKDANEKEKFDKEFRKNLKDRVDETAKYVRPQDGTLDFALMFIPSEAIFYDLLINKVGATGVNSEDFIQYAHKKHVNIVSPNSFYAFLQVILQGLKQIEFQKSTEEIRKRVYELGRHIKAYEDHHRRLGEGLGAVVGHFNASNKELQKIEKDVVRIGGEKMGIEPLAIEKPDDDSVE